MVKFYLAPMEGVTTVTFRRAYHKIFRSADKYFTPFLVPHEKKGFSAREWEELNPVSNQGMYVVPQILACQADHFVRMATMLKECGYKEVNLNLGCPSKTVVTKGRGSGFLQDPRKLDRFFADIFEHMDLEVSVKTRLGLESPLEFEDILAVYDKYPLKEVIIHPRVQADYYNNQPDMETFAEAAAGSRHRICYNGDLFCAADVNAFLKQFPWVDTIMLGRGIVTHPDLLNELCGMEHESTAVWRQFHRELLDGYCQVLSGDRNVLFKMKEFWSYFVKNFPDEKKLWKKLKKCEKLSVYETIVEEAFRQQEDRGKNSIKQYGG